MGAPPPPRRPALVTLGKSVNALILTSLMGQMEPLAHCPSTPIPGVSAPAAGPYCTLLTSILCTCCLFHLELLPTPPSLLKQPQLMLQQSFLHLHTGPEALTDHLPQSSTGPSSPLFMLLFLSSSEPSW